MKMNHRKLGDRFRTNLDRGHGEQRVPAPGQSYEVLLTEDILVSGEAELEITEVGCPMRGKVHSYCGNLPEIGHTFSAQIDRGVGPHQVCAPCQQYDVRVAEDILVDGETEIELVEHDLPMRGRVSSYCGNFPQVGEILRLCAERDLGPHRISAPSRQYDVEIDEDILIDGDVDVEIIEHGLPMQGTVHSYCGNLPEIGHVVRLQMNRGPGPHLELEPNGRYEVRTDEPVLLDGNLEVEITEHSLPMRGKIRSYCGNLPEIGDRVSVCAEAKRGRGPHRLAATDNRYDVFVNEPILIDGDLDIEITEHGLPMKGRIASYHGNLPQIGERFRVAVECGLGPREISEPDGRYTIRIDDDVLVTDEVELKLLEHGIPMKGKISSYCDNLPDIGHTFQAKVQDRVGTQRVISPDKRYEVGINENVLISAEVEIEVLEHAIPMVGRVTSYCGSLPAVGETVDVKLRYGSGPQRVRSPDDRYTISIDEYVLASGIATVELTEHGLPMKGQVSSYGTALPAAGDLISKRVRAGQRVVEAPSKTFEVELGEKVSQTGDAQIEIIEISDAIYGVIRDHRSIEQNLSGYRSPWRARSSLTDNRNITGRKL